MHLQFASSKKESDIYRTFHKSWCAPICSVGDHKRSTVTELTTIAFYTCIYEVFNQMHPQVAWSRRDTLAQVTFVGLFSAVVLCWRLYFSSVGGCISPLLEVTGGRLWRHWPPSSAPLALKCDPGWLLIPLFSNVTIWLAPENCSHLSSFNFACCKFKSTE